MRFTQPAKPFEAGRREDERVDGALGQTAQPGVDIAADLDRLQVGPDGGDLGRPSWAAGSDSGSSRKVGEG